MTHIRPGISISKLGYPKSVDIKSRRDLHGYSVNRIYKITKAEAVLISREFKLPTDFGKYKDDDEYDFYYLNQAGGEQHIVFWLPKVAA